MPPDPPGPSIVVADESALSDENVAILYEIVQNAEARPNVQSQPFRALFAAYEAVLPTHGIRPAHDRVYLRFIFRLGQKRREEETVFESFERLLQELGIQLEFKDDAGASQSDEGTAQESPDFKSGILMSGGRQRRASFSAVYDEGEEHSTWAEDRSRIRAVSQEPRGRAAGNFATRLTADRPGESINLAAGRVLASDRAQNHSARGLVTHTKYDRQGAQLRVEDVDVASDSQLEVHKLPQVEDYSPAPVPPSVRLYQPTKTQLFRDAETFQHYRIRAVARDVVEKWCDAALKAHQHHEHLHRLAVARDTEILVRQAFEHWRIRLHARKQAAATHKFFARLEKRALRARDLYLLTKALTHWAQSGFDEQRQRRETRQRVLAVKYFHAWYEITSKNQQMQRRKLLTRVFQTWNERNSQEKNNDLKAVAFHTHNIIEDAYWRWFWSFCERRAPEWHDRKLKQRCLFRWLKTALSCRHDVLEAVQDSRVRCLKKHLLLWSTKAKLLLNNERKGQAFRERAAETLTVQTWARELRYSPLQHMISNMADWRIAGTTLAIFVNRFRFEKQAEKLNRLRILRTTWTEWNDGLRIRTLSHRIDSDFLLTALYRWVIATRHKLLSRLCAERDKARSLDLWKQRRLRTKASSARQQDWLARNRKHRLRDAMSLWIDQMQHHRQATRIAHEYRAPKLAVDTLMIWKGHMTAKLRVDEGVQDARFFLLLKRVLIFWKKRTQELQRQRRRDAYALVRRRMKIRIASNALDIWRRRVRSILEQAQKADTFLLDQTTTIATNLFDKWKDQLHSLLDLDFEASGHYQHDLLKRSLSLLLRRSEDEWHQEEIALAAWELRTQKTAVVCFRKLRLGLIELKSRQGKGEVLKATHQKRHQMLLLHSWCEKTTAHKRKKAETPRAGRSRLSRRFRDTESMESTRRAEDWTELDLTAWAPATEAQTASAPFPVHLSTPSKRASRAKAIVQSTTPLGTPLQSRLRAQLNSTPFGRSRLGKVNFGSILEESPMMPGVEKLRSDE